MIITRTPYRVSLFGGGTDMPEWYSKKSGAVLSFTIDKYCYVLCRELPPYFDYVNSNGGVNGRKIKLVVKDDGYLPTLAVARVEFSAYLGQVIEWDEIDGLDDSNVKYETEIAT